MKNRLSPFVCQSKKKKTNSRPTWNDRSAFGSLKSYDKQAQMQVFGAIYLFALFQYQKRIVQMEMDRIY